MTSMLRRVKSRKGFTLTELIVVVAIVGLLMICVTAFVGPINKMVKATTADADAVTINEIAGDYIERRLAYANSLEMYVGTDADSGNNSLKDAYDGFQQYSIGANDVAGMLILKMIDKPGGASLDDTDNILSNNTYRIYDVPIEEIPPSGIPTTTYQKSFDNGLTPVFSDDFYGRYQHLILIDPDSYRGQSTITVKGSEITKDEFRIAVNQVKGKAYLNFDIYSYYFDESTGDGIKAQKAGVDSTMEEYYDELVAGNKTDTVFSDIVIDQSAYEHVSFELQNIDIGIERIPADPTKGTPEEEVGVASKAKLYYDGTGDDIVIFYNVPTYSNLTGLPTTRD